MRAALWKLVQWEGLQGDHIVLPTETSGHLPDLESFLTESTFLQLHSASDLLAQVLNQALLAKPLAPDECSLAAIREQLAPGLEYSALVAAVDKLRGSADYAYVAGFANYCKHQGYVEREHVSEYRSDSILSGTALHSFSYRKKQFPAKTYRQLDLMTGRLHVRNRSVRLPPAN